MVHTTESTPMKTAEEIQELQRGLFPKQDLTRFAGRWVALRDGHVIAHASTLAALEAHPAVRPDDVLTPVPRGGGAFVM